VKRGVSVLAFLLIVMLICGVLTTGVWGGLPTVEQTANPLGSYFRTTPGQATFFFLVVGFILFNLIGMGATIALVFWFFNREVKVTENRLNRSVEQANANAEVLPEKVSA
jgi:hypothetical protein